MLRGDFMDNLAVLHMEREYPTQPIKSLGPCLQGPFLSAPVIQQKRPFPKERPFKIGIARFELTTFCSQSRRSTRLSYIP